MNVFSYKLRKLLSDKNELTALPTASDSHAASLLPTSPKRDLGCPNQAAVATFVIQTRYLQAKQKQNVRFFWSAHNRFCNSKP